MNGKPNFKVNKPEDLFKLPTDTKEKPMTEAEAEAYMNSIAVSK